MAGDASPIARFMVELAFKQDEGSAQKFVKTVDQSEVAVNELQQAVNALGKAVQDLGRVLGGSAVEEGSRKFATNAHKITQSAEVLRKGLSTIATTAAATGTAWVAAISKIASEYEKLYYTARRVGGTVGDLKAAGDAANQAGIGVEALGGALEGITSQVRASPGIRMMVNNWIGADWDKVRDKVKGGLIPVLDRLTKMPRELAYQWADQLGISRRVLDDWIVNGEDFKKRMAEVADIQRRSGVDQEKLAQQSKEFWNSLRTIGVQIEQIWGKAFQEAYPAIKLVLDTLQGVLNVILIINKNVPGAALVESLVAATVSARILLGVLGRLTGLSLGGGGLLASMRAMGPALLRIGSAAKFALGPWGILIGVAVEAALHWRELADAFGEIGSKIGQAASLVAGNVTKAFSDLLSTLKPITDAISAVIKPIGDAIGYVAEKLGLVSTEQEKAARAAERAKPGYVSGYGQQPEQPGQPGFTQQYGGVPKAGESTVSPASPGYIHRGPTEQGLAPPAPGQHPTGEFFSPYGGVPKAKFAEGGIVPISAHAGEIVLPQKLSALLLGVATSLSGGGKGGDPWGDPETKASAGRLLDWLSGALIPKVQIDNVEDFDKPEQAHSGDGKPGPGGIRQGTQARTGMGGGGGGGTYMSGGVPVTTDGDGGGGGGRAGGRAGVAAGPEGMAGKGGGAAAGGGDYANKAISVFKAAGWTDAAIQAVMAHGLGEGGFGESWKQSGAINKKTGQREQSFGHWQFNMQGGEGPAYMKWAEKQGLDPKSTENQAKYVAQRMGPQFGQIRDFNTAFGQFETGFEKSAGGVAGKMAYAQREGNIDLSRRYVEGYKAPGGEGGAGMDTKGGAYGVPGAVMNFGEKGGLGTQAQAAQNLTQLQVPGSKKSVTVHKEAAEAFQGFLGELQGTGYKIGDIGGYNPRTKRGGSGWSEHAFGTAIDINAGKNAMGGKGTDMPANIKEMAAKYGLVWGGDWKGSTYDPMHFQWGGSRPWKEQQDKARAVAAEQGKKTGEKLAQVAGAKPPDAKSPIEEYNDKLIAAARKSDPTPLEEMKAKIDEAKTGGGELRAGGALKKSGADFDRALAPIGSSGLAPGAGGDSVTNNSGGNRNMNVQATNNVTINGNHNESPGSLARRFSDKSERFYGDLGRNNRAMVT